MCSVYMTVMLFTSNCLLITYFKCLANIPTCYSWWSKLIHKQKSSLFCICSAKSWGGSLVWLCWFNFFSAFWETMFRPCWKKLYRLLWCGWVEGTVMRETRGLGWSWRKRFFWSVLCFEGFGLESYSMDCRSMVDGQGKEVHDMYPYSQYFDQHKQSYFKIYFGYLDCVSLNVTSLWGVPWVGQQTCCWPWSHLGWHVHRAF